jgi:hypothetical protein
MHLRTIRNLHLIVFAFLTFTASAFAQQLQLTGLDGKAITVTAADLKAMPRHPVVIVNAHTKADEKYEGVLLSDVLAKINAPMGEKLRGPLLLTYVKAGASDNYHVLLALADVDPEMRPNEIIVADTMNGAALDAKQGPLKLIVPGDKRPARSVRMLTTILLHQAP